MATPRDKYYTKMYETLVDYNNRKDAPFPNNNIRQEICKIMADKESEACNITLDDHNVTVDSLWKTPVAPNTQRDNENTILTSKRLNNLDALAKTLKGLKTNDAGYYDSDENDAKINPESNPKVVTHTSDGNKRKLSDTSNRNLQQKLLINRTLLIITTPIDPQIDNIRH